MKVAVEKHFEDIHEDQFDFHSYCIRKVTLRTYVALLRWEDTVFGNDTYVQAAAGVIKNYLYLHNNPINLTEAAEPDYSAMTAAQRKKAKAVARKKKLKAEKKAAEEAKTEAENKKKGKNIAKDEDPNGEELLKKDPLQEAKKYAATLVKNAPYNLTTWLLQYDVSSRRGKALMALKALFRAKAIDEEKRYASGSMSSEVFKRIVDFSKNVCIVEGMSSTVQQVFDSEKTTLLGGKSLQDFVLDWSKIVNEGGSASACLSLRTEIAKAMVGYNIGEAADALKLIVSDGDSHALELVHGVTLAACEEAVSFLNSVDVEKATIFSDFAKSRYPLCSRFC